MMIWLLRGGGPAVATAPGWPGGREVRLRGPGAGAIRNGPESRDRVELWSGAAGATCGAPTARAGRRCATAGERGTLLRTGYRTRPREGAPPCAPTDRCEVAP